MSDVYVCNTHGESQPCGQCRVDPPVVPTVACVKCGHDRDDPRRRGRHPDDFNTTFCIYGCGCQCRFSPDERAAPPPDEADKALAHAKVTELLDGTHCPKHGMEWESCCLSEVSLELHNKMTAALAQARKEAAQPVHPDDLADMINKFLFEQYACTIDHPQMHVLKELVQWWPDPASKQER